MPHSPPGPFSLLPGRVTQHFRRDTFGFLEQLRIEYGDVAAWRSAGQRYVLISHPDLIKRILIDDADAYWKGPALQRSRETLGRGLLTSEDPLHRTQRKLMQPSFHARLVARYATDMVASAAAAAAAWRDGQALDIHEQMMRLTLIIAARTLFGADISREAEVFSRAMDVVVQMFRRAVVPWGPWLNRLPLPSTRAFRQARAKLFGTIERLIDERTAERARGIPRDDVMSRLLAARDEESTTGMTAQQLREECFTLLTAGHETTANALTFLWYVLGNEPHWRAAVADEVARMVGGRPVTADDLDHLPTLRRVVSEVLRLYPPAWTLGRMPRRDVELGGYRIKKGSTILLSQWVTHRDERWWPNPDTFDPDRWSEPAIPAADSPAETRPRWAYFPFGGGSRQCIGEAFAWLEIQLVAATLLQRLRFDPVSTTRLILQPTITLRPGAPVLMRVARTT